MVNQHDYRPLRIEGELPEELNGTYYQNGPGNFSSHGKTLGHIFTADGLIRSVRLRGGKAEGAVKLVDSVGRQRERNAGKAWSAPETDSFFGSLAGTFPTVTKLFQKLHPGRRYYLTNIAARDLRPADVRQWSDDLWMFPHYNDKKMVPYDVRDKGPASYGWPGRSAKRRRVALIWKS